MKILLCPAGRVEQSTVEHLQEDLREVFGCPMVMEPEIEIPSNAYHKKRAQYSATVLLNTVKKKGVSRGDKILGIVDVDIYVEDLNYIFGIADASTSTCIISLTRLRQEYYGNQSDEILFRQRTAKEAVHELGHLFGLGHCSEIRCIMHFSNSLQDTDIKQSTFCSNCMPTLIK